MRGLLILLLAYPFLELYSLFLLADQIGGSATLLWVIATVLLGMALMRGSKLGGLLTVTSTLRQGEVSLLGLLWPLRVMLAGLLFAIPGLISDLLALLLLLPWKGPKLVDLPFAGRNPASGPSPEQSADIIEGEYERVDSSTPRDRHLN